jgi:hypothetical protein
MAVRSRLLSHFNELAGLPALQGGESGQVRKEAATATTASAGGKARLLFRTWSSHEKHRYQHLFNGGINKQS